MYHLFWYLNHDNKFEYPIHHRFIFTEMQEAIDAAHYLSMRNLDIIEIFLATKDENEVRHLGSQKRGEPWKWNQ